MPAKEPSFTENIASPGSPATSQRAFQRYSFQSHGPMPSPTLPTSDSTNIAPRSNRFSMSFPVQPSRNTSPIRVSQSPVREPPSVVHESLALLTGSNDTNFLTAIAAQERRVLELKEELGRAEAELNKLKRHWAQHEAHKKREDSKRVTWLQSLHTSLPATDAEEDTDGSNAWMQQEMERRKALLSSNQASNRTVFSGSRHMRTLSLLSPDHSRQDATSAASQRSPTRPPRKETKSEQPSLDARMLEANSHEAPTAVAASDFAVDGADTLLTEADATENAIDKEMLLKHGKKMANELRDGLWTFWEDLRQATVGEEATKVEPPPRKQNSTASPRAPKTQAGKTGPRSSSRDSSSAGKGSTGTKRPGPKHTKSATVSIPSAPSLADPSFWAEHGVFLSQQATPVKVKKVSPAVRHAKSTSKVSSMVSSDNEGWDTWDENSPQSQTSRTSSAASESNTLATTVSNATSPRVSLDTPTQQARASSDSSRKDPIPWPALANLGPKALKRTASHLMAEWEKSLTPSPTKEDGGQDEYLGLGAEAAAAAVTSQRREE